jgi:hypothetical protein
LALASPLLGGSLTTRRNERMSTSLTRRGTALLAAATLSLLAALATASQAGAATYYACVKKNGSAHIYAKKPKCKKGESKLSWNSVGPAGRNGLNGLNGLNGKNGANGANGADLTTQTPLASGQSESGAFAVADGESKTGYAAEGITFSQPLPAGIAENHVVYNTVGTTTPQCPGPGKAAAGFVCLYESESSGMTFLLTRNFALTLNAADPSGFAIFWTANASSGYAAGTWTVTAG